MLANMTSRLSHQNMKTLYNACILPVLSYASPVWWTGNTGQMRKIEGIQNRYLRTIMPVFNATPIHAMQVESGVLPLHIRLNHMKQQAAARLVAKIDASNPIHGRLPEQLQREHHGQSDTHLPLPINPARKPGMPNKFKESTIHTITNGITTNVEKITPTHTIPPWRACAQDKQYTPRLTTNPAHRGTTKGEAADEHQTRIKQLSQDANYILTESHAFCMLNRHTLGVVTQAHTGHGYFGEHTIYKNPPPAHVMKNSRHVSTCI